MSDYMITKLILAKWKLEKDKFIVDIQRSYTLETEVEVLLKRKDMVIVRVTDHRYKFDDVFVVTNNYILYLDYDEIEKDIMPIDVELEKLDVRVEEEIVRDPDGDFKGRSVQLVFPIKKR